ncbi:MAG: site-2 protease family protein [Candidatus Spechtbacterales bacterium]
MRFRLFGTDIVAGFDALFLMGIFAWWGMGVITSMVGVGVFALLAFLSLLTHEFMHVFTGRMFKIPCRQIRVMFLGMGAHLEHMGKKPFQAFLIGFSGPLASFALVGLILLSDHFFDIPGIAIPVLQLLLYFNFIVGVFNILPLFPLDGGRVFHSIAWAVTKDRHKGLVAAVSVSHAFIVFGLGYLVFAGVNMFSLIWFSIIAFFLWQAGTAELINSHKEDQ